MKKSSENKTSTKRRFSTLFKQQTVERADKDGVAQVAKDLGITPGLIYNWRNSLANQSSEQEEIKLMGRKCETKVGVGIAQDDLAFKKRRRILRIRKSEIRLNSKYADQNKSRIAASCWAFRAADIMNGGSRERYRAHLVTPLKLKRSRKRFTI